MYKKILHMVSALGFALSANSVSLCQPWEVCVDSPYSGDVYIDDVYRGKNNPPHSCFSVTNEKHSFKFEYSDGITKITEEGVVEPGCTVETMRFYKMPQNNKEDL